MDENPEILGGGGADTPPPATTQETGSPAPLDWQSQVADLVKGNENFSKEFTNDVAGIQKLTKNYTELQKQIGAKGLTPLPENASDEQKAAWDANMREVLGVPKDPTGYKFGDAPEGQQVDTTLRDSFGKAALEAGLSPAQAAKLDAWSFEVRAAQQEAANAAFDEAAKKAFGDQAESKVQQAQALITANISPAFKDLVPNLDNNALLIMADVLLAQQKALGSEDKPTNDAGQSAGGGKSADELHSEKLKLMSEPAYTNAMDPRHQEVTKRVMELNTLVYKLRNPGAK